MLTRTERLQARIVVLIIAVIALILLTIRPVHAQQQQQQFYVFADTAGIAPITGHPGMYATWVFAKASPEALPSSGILVAWDCLHSPRMVKRLAQVVYQMTTDSTGVIGSIEEVDREWQEVSDQRLSDLVCRIGAQHEGTYKQPWLAPGKPRSDS